MTSMAGTVRLGIAGSTGSPALAHWRANLAAGHGGDGRQAPAAQMRLAHDHKRPLVYLANGAEDLRRSIPGQFEGSQHGMSLWHHHETG